MKIKKILAIILLCMLVIGKDTSIDVSAAEQKRVISSEEMTYTEDEKVTETSERGIQDSQSETIELINADKETEIKDDEMGPEMYVYNGEVFYEENISEYMRAVAGKIDYTYWAIHEGAGFGDILEDGRNLDHLGIIMLKVGRAWKTAYCIHHNANLQGGHEYADIEAYLTNTEKKELTGRALYYGFQFDGWTPDDDVIPQDSDKGKYTATQVMIWIIEKGWYTYDKNSYSFKINSKAINVAKTICAKSDQSPSGSSYKYFNTLYADMQNHDLMPSFVDRSSSKAKTMDMGYDFNKKQYSLTITDENNILSECTVSGMPSGLKVQKNGSKLVLTSSSSLDSTVTLKFVKKSFKPETAVTVWSDQDDSSYQQIGTYAEPDVSNITGYLKIKTTVSEVSAEKVWDDHDNKNQKRPDQIKIDLYRGTKKHEKATLVQTITLNEKNSWKSTVSNLPGKDTSGNRIFYTLEEKNVTGYEGSVKETCPDDYHWQYVFTNTENTGDLKLIKKSANQTLTEGNGCYSLDGAEYGVYTDKACTKSVGKLVTDKDGNSNVLADLTEGTYYVKEIKRPKGYKLDQEVHEIKVVRGEVNVLELTDIPVFSNLVLEIEKLPVDALKDLSRFPLTGTEFTIDFYPEQGLNQETLAGKEPTRSWVIQVVESKEAGKTVYRTALVEENLIGEKSDELYIDENGSAILPLGTITIRETASASDYKMEGYIEDNDGKKISDDPTVPIIIEISDDEGEAVLQGVNGIHYKNLTWRAYNELYKCSVQIIKSDSVRVPLAGVSFALLDEEDNKIAEGETDQNGNLSFENLIPGKYQLIETKTVDGHQLLKEPVSIQLPLELTEKEVEEGKIDKTQCVYDEKNKVYKLYNQVYKISNSVNFVLPMTGGNENMSDYLVLFGGLSCLSMAACWLIRKKENFSSH